MITISVVKVDNKEYFRGKIGKEVYNVLVSPEMRELLTNAQEKLTTCETFEEAQVVLTETFEATNKDRIAEDSALESVLGDDLFLNKKTGKYHVKLDNKIAKKPIHDFFVNKMIEANDKGLSPRPWLIFWVRLMRNDLYSSSSTKVQTLVNYLKAQYTCNETVEKYEKEGYSNEVSKEKSTFDQISITEEGILAAFKYVQLSDTKYSVEKDEKTGEQKIVEKARYERKLEVDENSGKVIKDELDLPTISEEFVFYPPVMGRTGGNPFTCADLANISDESPKGHIIKVGKVHELAKGFTQVNTNDDNSCVPGLHLGGHYYVRGYGGKTNYLLDCLVAPEDIGAVCDVTSYGSDGAIRCRRYMTVGAHFVVSKGMYHPSKYAQLLDAEWDVIKAEIIDKLGEQIKDAEAKL